MTRAVPPATSNAPSLDLLRSRPFAYADIFRHPPLVGGFHDEHGNIQGNPDDAVARVCKNESNCTVFLADGTWFTTWGQGRSECHDDQRVVFSVSHDMGKTWTYPKTIVPQRPEAGERSPYGVPFIVPTTNRIYLFFFDGTDPMVAVNLCFVFSDDVGETWSRPRKIALPDRPINVAQGRFNGWLNHPPRVMPTGEAILPLSLAHMDGTQRIAWQLLAAEGFFLRLDNILTERDADKLVFTLLPEGRRGLRVDPIQHYANPAINRLLGFFGGLPEDSGWNAQEPTLVALPDGRWLAVCRTFLGSPGFSTSSDRGITWSRVEPLRFQHDGPSIRHPMTMCPITTTSDGRAVLLFTNNDGSDRGARHVWDGDGRTRNPQWIVVGRQLHPNSPGNAGMVFGTPMMLVDVDDTGKTNLKTGISMPHFFERSGRFFVCYNINKEHLLLDEIPASVLDSISP